MPGLNYHAGDSGCNAVDRVVILGTGLQYHGLNYNTLDWTIMPGDRIIIPATNYNLLCHCNSVQVPYNLIH